MFIKYLITAQPFSVKFGARPKPRKPTDDRSQANSIAHSSSLQVHTASENPILPRAGKNSALNRVALGKMRERELARGERFTPKRAHSASFRCNQCRYKIERPVYPERDRGARLQTDGWHFQKRRRSFVIIVACQNGGRLVSDKAFVEAPSECGRASPKK